ncbi:MAG: ABC transporter substrate-binding protein [Chloroflexaceae bacterium]|nr:ABC transporter substrate-binding protein [Chloroflexaceae bacterium]
MNSRSSQHPAVAILQQDLLHGKITRREFLRMATLLGTAFPTALALAGCGLTEGTLPTLPTTPPTPEPVTRGGTLTIGSDVLLESSDPAQLSWGHSANQVRQIGEYLTLTDADNITHPWLLESWETSADVKVWTLRLRRGITFNNGDELDADDVIFSLNHWLNPATGSSMRDLLAFLQPHNIERVDNHTIRLYLDTPQIGLPEYLFHYPAVVLHRGFEGDFIGSPVGTGPFMLAEYEPGEHIIFNRRFGYWRIGADGATLPYLDRIVYRNLTPDERVEAMQAGLIDTLYRPRTEDWQKLQTVPGVVVSTVSTAQALVIRMRVDRPPWNDVRVRNAFKFCQDRQRILDVSFYGQGDLAIDAHVAPVHPAYCEKPIPQYDPARSRALLREAGYPEGLNVTLTTKNDYSEPEVANTLRMLAAEGGFIIDVNIVEPARYWEQWREVDLGITAWEHRPLDTMVLALGYVADAQGQPTSWNETRWVDQEFIDLVRQAEGTFDVAQRRALMCRIEDVMQERGPIGISYWRKMWAIANGRFKNLHAHPTTYDLLHEVWKQA